MAAAGRRASLLLFGGKETSATSEDEDRRAAEKRRREREEKAERKIDLRSAASHEHVISLTTIARKPLSRDVQIRFAVYEEGPDFGKSMKQGKSPAEWGPWRWVVYGCIRPILEHFAERALMHLPPPASRGIVVPPGVVSISTVRIWFEVQPYVLGCGKCRMSFGIAVAKRPVRKWIVDLKSMQLLFNYVHNRVNRRFNADPANDALPRKRNVSDADHVEVWRRLLAPFLADPRPTEPPDVVLVAFFNTMYYEADHYPDACDDPQVMCRRVHYRIDLALWCDLWPAGTLIQRALSGLFSLGDEFAALHRAEPTPPLEEIVVAAAKIPPSGLWRNSNTLMTAIHELEIAVRGRDRVVPLATREEFVRRSTTTTIPPRPPASPTHDTSD
jgi:hypothetical protein